MKWTVEEDEILRKNYSSLDKKSLLNILPNRSWDAIQLRGRRTFNIDRTAFIKQFGNTHAKGMKYEYRPRKKKEKCEYISSRGYRYVKVKEFEDTINGWEGYRPEHIFVIEEHIGRKLNRDRFGRGEGVHHLDGDKLNNIIDNLFLYNNEKEHKEIHSQLEKVTYDLIKKGIIKFNKQTKKYYHEQ
jgi:hypothetical protein